MKVCVCVCVYVRRQAAGPHKLSPHNLAWAPHFTKPEGDPNC